MEKVAQVQKNEHTQKDDAAFKAKKAEAAKAFAARQKERKEGIKKLFEELKAKNLIEKLAPEHQKLINDVLAGPARSGFGGQSFFNKVFGDTPKVGDHITLLDYMKNTLQAKGKLDKAIKEWAEKGIVVECTEKPNKLESVYTIKKM